MTYMESILAEHAIAIENIADVLRDPGESTAAYHLRQVEEYLYSDAQTATPRRVRYRVIPEDRYPTF